MLFEIRFYNYVDIHFNFLLAVIVTLSFNPLSRGMIESTAISIFVLCIVYVSGKIFMGGFKNYKDLKNSLRRNEVAKIKVRPLTKVLTKNGVTSIEHNSLRITFSLNEGELYLLAPFSQDLINYINSLNIPIDIKLAEDTVRLHHGSPSPA